MLSLHILIPYKNSDIEKISTSNLASDRLRVDALLTVAQRNDFEVTCGDSIIDTSDICLVTKLGSKEVTGRGDLWLSEIQSARKRGAKILLDFTDNHLVSSSAITAFYQKAVNLANICVCSSDKLASSLLDFYSGRIEVIPDAIEVAPLAPKQTTHSPITIFWFGHATNVDYLVRFLPSLERQQALKLLILTNEVGIKHLQSTPLQLPSNLTVEGGLWSVDNMTHAASLCDLCIIPSDLADPRKAGASSNRLLTALALGLPTAADRLDSYLEHSDYFTDIRSKDFDRLLENPMAFRDQVIQAQNGPVQEHLMQKIGQRWISLLESI